MLKRLENQNSIFTFKFQIILGITSLTFLKYDRTIYIDPSSIIDMETMTITQNLLSTAESGLRFASKLSPRISYSIKNDAVPIAGSIPTSYRRLNVLEQLGLARVHRGQFQINPAARKPLHILEKLMPSLVALKNAKRFGRKYHSSDIKFFKNNLPKGSFVTLDYRAWDLTRYQYPLDLYVYVNDIEKTSEFLKAKGFSEGTKGHIVLLQKQTNIKNTVEQIYFDCIAKGGRSVLDAIAIELKYGDELSITDKFNTEAILKVQDDMQTLNNEETS